MKLIVGLGNPGNKYEHTRHNIGFDVVDLIAKKLNANQYKEKFQGLITEGNYKGEKFYVLKPQTFMNLSGDSIGAVAKFYKIEASDIVVIYDDMDLPLGKLRYREDGSSGGHNGIKSTIAHIGDKFKRIKCGIGKPQIKDVNIDFVLGRFMKEEQPLVDEMALNAISCVEDILAELESQKIMQKYNKK